jgi:hypothetical protein
MLLAIATPVFELAAPTCICTYSPSQLHVQYIRHFHFTNLDDRLIFLLYIITAQLANLALIKIFC